LAENDAASQAESSRQAKSYASGNDLFSFSAFWIVTKKTGNTSAEKLPGRTHPMLLHGVYPLHRLLEDSSMKSYGEEKTHLNSTNNNFGRSMTRFVALRLIRLISLWIQKNLMLGGIHGNEHSFPESY
jgi:hypothetical protein